MSGVTISLGGVVLQDFEVPEKIIISAGQQIAIHNLIGGGRVVDALGANAGSIEFGGAFSGGDAAIRAQLLEAATATGAQIPLYWSSFFFTVVIQKCEVRFEKPWWIPFSLRCIVVLDPAGLVDSLVNSVTNLVAADMSSALSLAPQAGLSLALPATPSVSGLLSAQSFASAALGTVSANLVGQTAGLNHVTDPVMAAVFVTGLASTCGQLAALSTMGGYLERASKNLAYEGV